ncbi:MAG: hypothetical protein FWE67_10520 [Planctomycetaceae bacterium]|nr:hypothetical protein [Planctomycetaceae bacterium]
MKIKFDFFLVTLNLEIFDFKEHNGGCMRDKMAKLYLRWMAGTDKNSRSTG